MEGKIKLNSIVKNEEHIFRQLFYLYVGQIDRKLEIQVNIIIICEKIQEAIFR
jgi:hypothetical protein